MTHVERTLLRAQIALLRSPSPTKGRAATYSEDDWRRALAKVSHRLTYIAFRRP